MSAPPPTCANLLARPLRGGDGRLKLIERLAAAYRAAELLDYMLKLVDSLRRGRSTHFLSRRSSERTTACPQHLTPRFTGSSSVIANVFSFQGLSMLYGHGHTVEPLPT